jgi:hypothetical protein
MRSGPTDRLQCEKPDEGGEGRVVRSPAGEEAGGEAETLVGGEDAEYEGGEVVDWVRWGVCDCVGVGWRVV